jgi:hypothetical protein
VWRAGQREIPAAPSGSTAGGCLAGRASTCLRRARGDPAAEEYPSGDIPYPVGFEEGWIVVADDLEYTNPLVSTVMDETRQFIAHETDRDEDTVEKADAALVGLTAQLLDTGEAERVVLLTTDKPAGQAAERILPRHGFDDRLEYRYVSEAYLDTITAREFR